jgi:predicted nucleic acid-binding protein
MTFIDTNYLLRFILKDIVSQHEEAKQLLLKGSRGEEKLVTSTVVFFELYWVLSSYYKKNKSDLVLLLKKILDLDFVVLKERSILIDSVKDFSNTNFDLEDCYNLSFAKTHKIKEFKTFDEKLVKQWNKETRN